jgi:hypothetical protein
MVEKFIKFKNYIEEYLKTLLKIEAGKLLDLQINLS